LPAKTEDIPVEIQSEESRVENGIAYAKGDARFSHADVTISADEMRYNPQARIFEADGNPFTGPARLSCQEMSIKADQIRYKPFLKLVEASGNAVVTQPGQSLTGHKVWFNLRTRTTMRESDFLDAWPKR